MPTLFPFAGGRRRLALAILVALPLVVHAAGDDPSFCPAGVVKCPKKPTDWSMCGKNDLLDVYTPGLPTTGDRAAAPQDLSAETVRSTGKTGYVLEKKAEIRQLDLFLRAEKITYDSKTTAYEAEGPISYQDRSIVLAADTAKGNTQLEQCTLEGVRYQLLSSRGNGVAQVAAMTDQQHGKLTDATFSTCDPSHQQWAFAAREIELDREHGVGYARDMTFRVHNVPVFWLPYARFPLDDRRVSGFLYPTVGFGKRRGFDLTLPYYFNLAPNVDLTLSPRLMTERGVMLGGEFRYLTSRSEGQVDAEVLPHDRRADVESRRYGHRVPDTRWSYQWRDRTSLGAHWSTAVDLNRVSDAHYFEDFGRGLYTSAISFLPSSAYLNGQGRWWRTSFGGDAYQITDPTLSGLYEPYRRLPRATFNAEHALVGRLTGGVDAEFVAFGRSVGVTGRRFDAYPHLALPLETAGWFLRPELGYRWTAYDLDGLGQSGNPLLVRRAPRRGMPILSLDGGLVFEREFHFRDTPWIQTLEPRLFYLRVPYRDQTAIPVFDTQEVPFTFGQMFRSNRFVGADRQMDANNLTLALTTRFLESATGTERLSASLGQIRYFGDQRVQLPGPAPTYAPIATTYSGSAYAGQVDLRLSDRWRMTLDQQWNPNTRRTDLSTFGMQNRFGDGGLFNFAYRFRRDYVKQVDVSAAIPLGRGWRLIGRENYALSMPLALPGDPRGTRGRSLERFLGVEHEGCCMAWRVIARRWIHNTAGEYDNALYFELEFKGVGSIGQRTDAFLRRAILGYQ